MSRILKLALWLFSGCAFGLGGDFTLTAHDGASYSLSQARGKAVVISFGYTSCPDICPTALATVAAALEQLGEQAAQVQAMFVSLDPQRDTPEQLANYVRYFGPNILGLTGDAQTLKEVANRYRVRYSFVRDPGSSLYTLDHSASLYVIDRQGVLFRMLPHGMPPSVLARSLRAALRRPTRP